MKRFFITAALAISMLTLLTACGGDSTDDQPANQGTPLASIGIEPINPGTQEVEVEVVPTTGSIIDMDAEVGVYLDLMASLATALRSSDTTDLSAEGLQPISRLTTRLETFSGFFNGLNEEGRNHVFGKYGVELRQSAERVATYAVTVQDQRGDEAISQELARLPAFAIATTNVESGADAVTTEPVQAPDGDISTLLTVNDVSGFAGGVGLVTEQIDMKSRAAAIDPKQVENMISFDSLSFDTADGSQGLALTSIHFVSEDAAIAHLELVASPESGMQELPQTIGDGAFFLEVNQSGIGSALVFRTGDWVIQLHTAQPDGVSPLVDLDGVEGLARIIADRI